MRILGEISHPSLKISVLEMNNRFSIKFENGKYEQVYKIRQDDRFKSIADFEKLVDSTYLDEVQQTFTNMHNTQLKVLERNLTQKEFPFPNII